jgi:NADPH:quinone reductase-like Zn-dependent oxidoreductase
MNTLPETQTAIVGLVDGTLTIVNDARLPKLADDMILVKCVCVGLNPVDTKMVGRLVVPGAVVGTDFAGHVVAIGNNAQYPGIKIGDRVAGVVQTSNPLQPDIGAFTEYVGATGYESSPRTSSFDKGLKSRRFVTMKLPDGMSFEEGASIGSGIGTIGLALFRSLEVPGYPEEPAITPKYVLVYGGSSATGTMAIQLLKLYRDPVIYPKKIQPLTYSKDAN